MNSGYLLGAVVLATATLAPGAMAALKPEPFNPSIASFSNELEFDALRGQVKTFEQALYNDQNKPVMYAKGSFDKSGCLNEYEKLDSVNNTRIKLVRDVKTNTLVSSFDKSKTIELNKACQVVSLGGETADPKEYVYNDNFLVKVKGRKDAWVYKEYFYNPDGMPKAAVLYGDEKDILLITVPKQKLSDNWDYVSEAFDDGKPMSQAIRKCNYDKVSNPTVCYFVTLSQIDGTTTRKNEQIRYRVTYY